MSYNPTGAPTAPPPRGKGMLITGAVLLAIGIIGIILGIVMTVNAATSLLSKIGAPQTAPATFTSQLDGGSTYAIYEATAGTGAATTVAPTAISVTGPSGAVAVSKTGGTVSVTDNNQHFAEVAVFTPPATGSYTIAVAGNGTVVAMAPALSTAAKGFAWIVAVIVGGLFAVVGLILLIIGAVRRSSSRRPPAGQFGGPPGAAPVR